MRHRYIAETAAIVVLLCARMVSAAPAATRVAVRVYDNGGIGPPLAAALAGAHATLVAAGADAAWLWCGAANTGSDPGCGVPLQERELAVRVVRIAVAPGYAGRLPLGDSLIDAPTHIGVLATIYYDRVAWLAAQSGTDVTRLLGRTIAHELGHLLIGSQRHSESGLMRAVWTREDLERARADDWRFTSRDAAAIRRRASLAEARRQARWLPRFPSSSSGAAGSDAGSSDTLPLQ
jgi:hypothetical protein